MDVAAKLGLLIYLFAFAFALKAALAKNPVVKKLVKPDSSSGE